MWVTASGTLVCEAMLTAAARSSLAAGMREGWDARTPCERAPARKVSPRWLTAQMLYVCETAKGAMFGTAHEEAPEAPDTCESTDTSDACEA